MKKNKEKLLFVIKILTNIQKLAKMYAYKITHYFLFH